MADPHFIEVAQAVMAAVRMFLDTVAVYGADDPRTREQKEHLARALAALMPGDVDDAPRLHVIRVRPGR